MGNIDPAIRGTILVTGASGFIGTHLVRRLSQQGHHLICVDTRPPREVIQNAEYITEDIKNLSKVEFKELDKIYNLAAIHTTPGHLDHEYYDTNVTGALEIVRVAERFGVRQIVFTSSISVYGPSEDRKTESSVPEPVSAYGKSKLIAEQILRNWQSVAADRRLVVVRPAVVFGKGEGGNFARMAALLRKGFFVFPGRRDTIKSCIYVEDLIDLIAAAEADPASYSLLNGCYPECPTLEQIVGALQQKYFPQAKLLDVPASLVLSAAKGLQIFSGTGLGVHPDRVYKLLRSTYVYPEWATQRSLLGEGAFEVGLIRWAEATDGSFV